MEIEPHSTFNSFVPPVFDGENYHAWAFRIEVHLEALDLWEAVEYDYEIASLPDNPTVAQMKNHKEMGTRKFKTKACLFSAVSSTIFTRIMNLESAKAIWDYLKQEYHGNERSKNMLVLNVIREFEMVKMKESETVKDYSSKLLGIVNKIRLLGKEFGDERIVQKILVTLPEKYESKISSLKKSKNLSSISLAELINALQAQEQRRMMRKDEAVEGAFNAKAEGPRGNKNYRCKGMEESSRFIAEKSASSSFCPHCKKTNHEAKRYWWRPDIKCRKCGNLGHVERVCTFQKPDAVRVLVEEHDEERLFVASCFAANDVPVLESEDEDGSLISFSRKRVDGLKLQQGVCKN